MRMLSGSRQRPSGSDAMAGFCVRKGSPCQLAVIFGRLPSMEAEIDCKLQSNSRENHDRRKTNMNMNRNLLIRWAATLSAAFALTTPSSFAQQITGTPGSPDATTTISGNQL